ncbi:hypothetical protein [Microbulbifer sp. TB1203]|uniref:hypothetical protein n=1 Tax=unclassified Microbulbifer TaxID=2619833 RepID=UPI0035B133F7
MQLKAGCEVEYKNRHDDIWHELEERDAHFGIYIPARSQSASLSLTVPGDG